MVIDVYIYATFGTCLTMSEDRFSLFFKKEKFPSRYVNTLEYIELLDGLLLIAHMEVRQSFLYYGLLLMYPGT